MKAISCAMIMVFIYLHVIILLHECQNSVFDLIKKGWRCLSLPSGTLVNQKGYISLKDGGNTTHLCIL